MVPKLYHAVLDEWLDIGLDAAAEGGALFAAQQARSTVNTLVHGIPKDRELFSVVDVDGGFEHDHGARPRPIEVFGALRCTQTGRTAILTQRDAWERTPGRVLFVDDDGSEYDYCGGFAFEIGAKARITNYGEFAAGAGEPCWSMPYRITLLQLEV